MTESTKIGGGEREWGRVGLRGKKDGGGGGGGGGGEGGGGGGGGGGGVREEGVQE